MNQKEKTALIFGVSGQDGAYLAQFLLAKGYRVVGASRDAVVSSFGNLARLGIKDKIKCVSASSVDYRNLLQVINTVMPDEIYNLAGQSSVGLSFEQPVETFDSIANGTLNLLEAIRFLHLPARLFNASSGDCFGNTPDQAATENSPFCPRSPYAVAKTAAFWQVANYRDAYGIYASSGILFNHESPLRPLRFVTQKIVDSACRIAAGCGEKLSLGNLAIYRDWGWAPEYVDAMWRILQQDQPDDFIIATGRTQSLEYFVSCVFSCLDLDWREHVQTNKELLRPTDIPVSAGNPTKAAELLGWRPTSFIEDVAQMMVAARLSTVETPQEPGQKNFHQSEQFS
ncbi:MAG: GDP-mannose 4,6-dehydratase [Chlorobium sp.]|nr:GDP-mannose 4,6-dehydratase [Chlorobium sp.]